MILDLDKSEKRPGAWISAERSGIVTVVRRIPLRREPERVQVASLVLARSSESKLCEAAADQ